jgi:hypothetical protein
VIFITYVRDLHDGIDGFLDRYKGIVMNAHTFLGHFPYGMSDHRQRWVGGV